VLRMRTIAECARLIKEDDPQTAITQNAIRSMVLTGRIPHVKVGAKRLINYDLMVNILQNSQDKAPEPTAGIIRRVV